MNKYICEKCFNVTNEDVWDCQNCHEESKIYEITIRDYPKTTYVSFHPDVSYATSQKLLPYIINNNYKLKHSTHNETLAGLELTFVYERQ